MGLALPALISAPAAAALGASWPQVDEDGVDTLATTFDRTADALDTHALDADRHTRGVLAASTGGLAHGLGHASGSLVGAADSTAATTSARLRTAASELTADAAGVRSTKVGVVDDLSTLTERLAVLDATGPLTAGGSALLPVDEVDQVSRAIAQRHTALVDALGGAGSAAAPLEHAAGGAAAPVLPDLPVTLPASGPALEPSDLTGSGPDDPAHPTPGPSGPEQALPDPPGPGPVPDPPTAGGTAVSAGVDPVVHAVDPDSTGPVRIPGTAGPDADPARVSAQSAAPPDLAPAAVAPAGAPAAPPLAAPSSSALAGPGPTLGGAPAAGPSAPGPTTAGPTTAGPTTAGPTAPGPTTAGPTAPGPTTAGPTTAGPAPGGAASGGGAPNPAPAGPRVAGALPPAPTARVGAPVLLDPGPRAAAAGPQGVRAPADPGLLLLGVAFPADTALVRSTRPARQLPLPLGEARPGLCVPPGDHPGHPDLVLRGRPAPEPVAVDLASTSLLHGWDPLGGGHERDLERRFVVRAATADRPAEHAWPPAEPHPEGAVAPDRRRPVRLEVGAELDLLGSTEGRVVAAAGTPFAHRAQPAEHAERPLVRLRVVRPLPAWESHLAGWFAQPGGGLRYRLTHPVAELVATGWLTDAAERTRGR